MITLHDLKHSLTTTAREMRSLTFNEAARVILDARARRGMTGWSAWRRRFSPPPAYDPIVDGENLVGLLEVLSDQHVIVLSDWAIGKPRRIHAPTAMHLLLWHMHTQQGLCGPVYSFDANRVTGLVMNIGDRLSIS